MSIGIFSRRRGALLRGLLILASIAVVSPAGASPRVWQPLLLRGKQLPQLLNVPVSRIEVLAVHHGRLEPIPFQVDSVLIGGIYALPQGPVPTAIVGEQAVGPDDEITMMMFDLGERIPDTTVLPTGALEVAVTDPLGGPQRYVYMAAVKNPRLSPAHYVDYDPRHEIVETDSYRLGFKNEFPDDFRLQSHKGELSQNLIDGFELRGRVSLLNLIKVHLTEKDIKSRLLAYRVGPVRVIRRVGHRIEILKPIQSPEVSTVEFFYRDFGQAPFTMRLPWHRLFRDVQGTIAMEFMNLRGYSILASGLEQPIEINNSGAAAIIDHDTPATWLALRGGGRLMLQTFAPSADLDQITRELYYQAEPCRSGGPQCGLAAAVGIETDGWQRLSSGPHRFDPLLISAPENYGARTAIDEASTAVVVTVRVARQRSPNPSASVSRAVISQAPLSEPGK